MPTCCVRYCTNRSGNIGSGQFKYFYFPKDPELRKKWMMACGKNEATYNANHGRICHQHFEDECFEQESIETSDGVGKVNRYRLKLIPGSIPTKLLVLKKARKEKPRERIPLYTYNGLVSALRKSSNSSDPSEATSAAIDHNYIATLEPTEPQISECFIY
ncbi:Uncharacterized protein GBIM_05090, partial [Gryllus bimaculatus]